LVFGADYFELLGPQQTSAGSILIDNRNYVAAGLGPNVVFSFSDAVYAPLAARQDLRAREAIRQASVNDSSLAVTEAYFGVQQARGELTSALISVKYAEDVAIRTQSLLAKGLTAPSEVNRANAEFGRRKQTVSTAREHWRTAGAELARILRLDPSALVEPMEPPYLPVTVIHPGMTIDELIPIGLTSRPEHAQHQAVVQATLTRLKQEKLRPLIPSLAVRSTSTVPSGSMGYGIFGGGVNGTYSEFDPRLDIDVQLMWQFQSLGLGNVALVRGRKAEYQAALLDLFRTQDRVAAEVSTAFSQARSAAERVNDAEPALREAIELANKSVAELGQTRRIGDSLILLLRPQEAVAAVQSFAQAAQDFFTAVSDYNRAQFRLYRALGHPANCLLNAFPPDTVNPNPLQNPAQPPAVPGVPRTENLPPPDMSLPQTVTAETKEQRSPSEQKVGTTPIIPPVNPAVDVTWMPAARP
jgi:outer membrane protein TolC